MNTIHLSYTPKSSFSLLLKPAPKLGEKFAFRAADGSTGTCEVSEVSELEIRKGTPAEDLSALADEFRVLPSAVAGLAAYSDYKSFRVKFSIL